MAYFEGIEMTGGYGNGPDIISSCSVNVNNCLLYTSDAADE